jgi:hypothetical protein
MNHRKKRTVLEEGKVLRETLFTVSMAASDVTIEKLLLLVDPSHS